MILIADEPTANLDKLTTKEIIDLLKKINDFRTTILVTTHNENIVNNLQKRVITLKNGKIVNDQKANGIYRLDETPVPPVPVRKIQEPGHALRPGMVTPIVQPTPRVINNGVAGVSPSLASRQMAKQPAARTLAKAPAQQVRAVTTQSSRAVSSRAPRNASKANMRMTSKSPARTATKQSRLGVNRKVM
jgi:ABC-type glutathione transport system ATPase component